MYSACNHRNEPRRIQMEGTQMSNKWALMTSQGGKVTFGCTVGYILGSLRWLLLIGFSLLAAVLCVLRIPLEKITSAVISGDNLLLRIVGILGILYILVLGISLLFRLFRPVLGENAKLKLAFLSVLYTSKNLRLIKLIRKISFWGVVVLLGLVISKKLSINDLTDWSKVPTIFGEYFKGFLAWSVVMLAVSTILSLLYDILYLPREGEGVYPIPVVFLKDIVGSFKITYKCITTWVPAKNSGGKTSLWQLIRFILTKVFIVAFIIFMVFGIISIV